MNVVYVVTWVDHGALCSRVFTDPQKRTEATADLKAAGFTYHLSTCTVEA